MAGDAVTIDKLAIEVSSEASDAVKELERLAAAFDTISKATAPRVATNIRNMGSAFTDLGKATSALNFTNLSQISNMRFSKTVATNVRLLGEALQTIPASQVVKLKHLSAALSQINGMKFSKSVVTNLGALPGVLRQFQNLDMDRVVSQLSKLNGVLPGLCANLERMSAAYAQMPRSMRNVASATRSVVSANRSLESGTRGATLRLSSFQRVVASSTIAVRYLYRGISHCVGEVNDYIEDMNLFNAAMGEYAEQATEYGQRVQDALGIDLGEWSRNQGVFQTLITGMGMTSDKASVMSQQLTQLGYDIASFYNISVEDAMTKIQSGIAGELEPLRRLGWDLSVARMQQDAYNMGIEENVSNMTQANKVALRYYEIMNQVTIVQGDMARTIASPANQLRVLQAQLTLTARAIGNLFIPALNAILPVVIAVVKAVRLLAQTIANFFGIDATFEVDYSSLNTSGIATVSDDADDAAESIDGATDAAEKFKRSVMGFDELNKMSAVTDSSSGKGAGAAAGGDLDLPIDTYDFLGGLTDNISKATDEMAEKLAGVFKAALPWVLAIGAGIAAWKIAEVILAAERLALCLNPVAVAIGVVAGLAVLGAAALFDMWQNGQNWTNVMQAGASELGLAGVYNLLCKMVPKAVEFIGPLGKVAGKVVEWIAPFANALKIIGKVAGVLGTVISVIDLVISGVKIFEAVVSGQRIPEESLLGVLTSTTAIGAMFGPWGALIGFIVGGVIGIAAEVYNNWDAIYAFVCSGLMAMQEFFNGFSDSVGAAWDMFCLFITSVGDGVYNWFVDRLMEAQAFFDGVDAWFHGAWETAGSVFQGIGEGIFNWFVGKLNAAQSFFNSVDAWFKGTWNSTCSAIRSAGETVYSWVRGAIDGARSLFSGLGSTLLNGWSSICSFFQSAGSGLLSWFQNNLVNPMSNAFWGVVNGVRGALNSIIGAINSIHIDLPDPVREAVRALTGVSISYIGFSVPYLATGGQVDSGQLFVARENGLPEMVGTMGGKSTVANNAQIVEGIEQGVTNAMIKVMSVSGSGSGETVIEIPLRVGNEELARAVWRGNASLVRRGEITPTFA